MVVTKVFQTIKKGRGFSRTETFEDFCDDISKIFLLEWWVNLKFSNCCFDVATWCQEVLIWCTFYQVGIIWFLQVWQAFRHNRVEENFTNSCHHDFVFLEVSPRFVKAVCCDTNTGMQVNNAVAVSHHSFIRILEDHTFAFTTSFFHSQVVVTQNHILRRCYNWFPIFRVKDVLSSQHQDTSFCLSFF
ncbi:Uncharacterised protein [Chlamydia trachomatis]|nr:Uncharacterised protein [Chlamydia trachomatis]